MGNNDRNKHQETHQVLEGDEEKDEDLMDGLEELISYG